MIYKKRWHEAGNKLYGTGHIERDKIPLHIYILDLWFERFHPHWDWWYKLWSKIIPDWGDPFCVGYCFVWSNYVWKKTIEEYKVEVGFDKLSEDYKEWYDEMRTDDDDEEMS